MARKGNRETISTTHEDGGDHECVFVKSVHNALLHLAVTLGVVGAIDGTPPVHQSNTDITGQSHSFPPSPPKKKDQRNYDQSLKIPTKK